MSERARWAEEVETHRVIEGRRWRVSDPRIPEALRQLLVNELMGARRAVGAAKRAADETAERAARDRVQAAKVALGERGARWWLRAPGSEAVAERIAHTRRALERCELPPEWELAAAVSAVVSEPGND